MQKALTAVQQRAAILVAEDEQTDEEIATQVGVRRNSITRWKRDDAFRAVVAEHVDRLSRELQKFHIARKEKRVAEYNNRWRAIIALREARAEDLHDIPGGSTGLLVHQIKQVGAGSSAQVVDEYAADTALLNAQLSLEKQASQEVGQWADKSEVAATGTVHIKHEHSFDYGAFRQTFTGLIDGAGRTPARTDGTEEPVDTTRTDA